MVVGVTYRLSLTCSFRRSIRGRTSHLAWTKIDQGQCRFCGGLRRSGKPRLSRTKRNFICIFGTITWWKTPHKCCLRTFATQSYTCRQYIQTHCHVSVVRETTFQKIGWKNVTTTLTVVPTADKTVSPDQLLYLVNHITSEKADFYESH